MIRNLTFDEAMDRISGKDYIIYGISELLVGKQAGREMLSKPEEIYEARFFDEQEEIHLFDFDGNMKISLTNDDGEEIIKETQYQRNAEFPQIEIRKYIRYDEYNQAYVYHMRPSRLIGGQ